jgi:hypothetical protein
MERELSECRLEETVLHHRIAAEVFVPFTVLAAVVTWRRPKRF